MRRYVPAYLRVQQELPLIGGFPIRDLSGLAPLSYLMCGGIIDLIVIEGLILSGLIAYSLPIVSILPLEQMTL